MPQWIEMSVMHAHNQIGNRRVNQLSCQLITLVVNSGVDLQMKYARQYIQARTIMEID